MIHVGLQHYEAGRAGDPGKTPVRGCGNSPFRWAASRRNTTATDGRTVDFHGRKRPEAMNPRR
jgi:hypothetical protein